MTGPEHTYTQAPWLIQGAMDLQSCTGAVVILRDQAEDPYCTRYDYITHGVPMESGMDEHHQVEP